MDILDAGPSDFFTALSTNAPLQLEQIYNPGRSPEACYHLTRVKR